jgi:8-oxo-dGTP diphosphatase
VVAQHTGARPGPPQPNPPGAGPAPARTLRGTAIVAAPARTVAAALAEPWLVRDCLAPLGIRVRADRDGQLGAGDRLVLRPRTLPALPLRVVRADGDGVLAGATGGVFPALRVEATLAETGAGTLLTYAIGWTSPGGALGRVADVGVLRRVVLRALSALLDGVRVRAEGLAAAPVVVGTVLRQGNRVLAAQRDRPPHAAGRWEFPGGRVEAGESERAAVARECREELAADVVAGDRVGPDVVLPNGWLLRLYAAGLADGAEPVASEHRAVRWVSAAELADLPWLDADALVLPSVRALLTA